MMPLGANVPRTFARSPWTSHYNQDKLSAANGLNQLTATTPGRGQSSVPSLSYDGRGNLTGIGSAAYGYSSQNQLLNGPNSALLTYDPAMRLYKTGNASGATKFQYDGTDIIAEYSNGNVLQRRYVHGPGPSTGSGQANQPIVQYEGTDLTTKRFFTADERGSVIAVTDSAGASIATNRYDEYGQPASTNASIANGGRFQYTGQAWLPELGLYHYKARTYNPSLGRFMQSDPIGYGDGMNMNNYVGGDPVNFVDPTGRSCERFPGGYIRFRDHDENGRFDGSKDTLEEVVVCAASRSRSGSLGGLGRQRGAGGGSGGGGGGGASTAPKPTDRCGVRKTYPVPSGYQPAFPDGDTRYIRQIGSDFRSAPEINPSYQVAINNRRTNWWGVAADLAVIGFGVAAAGGAAAAGTVTVTDGLLGAGAAGAATGSELAHSDGCSR